MAPIKHINPMIEEQFIRNDPNLPPRIRANFAVFADLMKVSRFRPVTPAGQLLWDQHIRAFEKSVRHTYTPEEALARGQRRVQTELDLIFRKKVYPRVNWLYPIVALIVAAALALIFIYLRFGRRQLLQRMARPEARAGYLFAAPWLLGFSVLTAGPILVSILYSFCSYDVLHPAEFAGLDNYRLLFTDDPLFWKSLANTAFMMLGIPIGMAAGMAVALLLNTKVRGMRLYRTIFYLPAIVPVVPARSSGSGS
jgi:multiple sugar transport system permease protein